MITIRTVLCFAILLWSCSPERGRTTSGRTTVPRDTTVAQQTSPAPEPNVLTIARNTQATLDDVRIGAGNFAEGDYTKSDGSKAHGPTAALWIFVRDQPPPDRGVSVGTGSSFRASRYSFEVIHVGERDIALRYSAMR